MSKTIRKRRETFEHYYRNFLRPGGYWEDHTDVSIARQRARYYSHTEKWYTYSLPKEFRNSINRIRRAHDRREIFKELNINGYEEQCSKWNCKDSRAWGYW
jgi:hypothetical protein